MAYNTNPTPGRRLQPGGYLTVKIGLTYMTGALVRIGKRIATAIMGGDRLGWIQPAMLFMGMLSGATLGALTEALLGGGALWVATAAMLGLTLCLPALPRPVAMTADGFAVERE